QTASRSPRVIPTATGSGRRVPTISRLRARWLSTSVARTLRKRPASSGILAAKQQLGVACLPPAGRRQFRNEAAGEGHHHAGGVHLEFSNSCRCSPTVSENANWARYGLLVASQDAAWSYARAMEHVDKILHGAKPS